VIVHQGQVTLEGMVSNAWERRQAYEEARKVEDVTSVLCNLSVARDVSDTLIAREVERRILEHAFYTIFENIDVRVRHGQVILRGEVMADARGRAMADIAAKVHGVVEVANFIRTLPLSLEDDDIRHEIAGRLYEDPSSCLQADAFLAPIHIIVEHGHVKLTGMVDSDVERRAVEMIARQAAWCHQSREQAESQNSASDLKPRPSPLKKQLRRSCSAPCSSSTTKFSTSGLGMTSGLADLRILALPIELVPFSARTCAAASTPRPS
jgi:osmotically-inducible protein OsmY